MSGRGGVQLSSLCLGSELVRYPWDDAHGWTSVALCGHRHLDAGLGCCGSACLKGGRRNYKSLCVFY